MLGKRLKKQRNRKSVICAVILFLMPFLMLAGGNAAISAINQKVYGLPVRNEASASFGRMIKTMYSVRNEKDIERVSVSAEKLNRFYAVSPTLRKIEPELTAALQQADKAADLAQNDGEVEDGWFYWCVRRALENSKIAPTLPEADAFYLQVNQELEDAIKDPDNGFETQWVMPSALMSPWRAGYAGKLAEYTINAVEYMITYQEVTAEPRVVEPAVERMSYLFEGITGNASVHSEEGFVKEYRRMYIDRADAITSVYRLINPWIAILSMILYLGQGIWSIIRKKAEEVPWLLVSTGIGLSTLLLLIGLSYTDMTAFIAIRYTYMTGGHALMLAFEWIAILRFMNRIHDFWAKKRKDANGQNSNGTDNPDALPE